MRKSVFLQYLGDDFITEAFRLTQQAAPKAEFYYNDYNNKQPAKQAGCLALLKKVKDTGVRIDETGIQSHWHVEKVLLKDIEESILHHSTFGLKVMFTNWTSKCYPATSRMLMWTSA